MRKYQLRSRLHPEVLCRGSLTRPIIDTVKKHLEGVRRPTSGHVDHLLTAMGDTDVTHAQLFWALHQWEATGKAIYYVEPGLAEALTHTDYPADTLWDLKLPEKAIYIALHPIFSLEHFETGAHPVEGIYLVYDDVMAKKGEDGKPVWSASGEPRDGRSVVVGDPDYLLVHGVAMIGIGAAKGYLLGMEDARDDAIITTCLTPGMPLKEREYLYGGVKELMRVAVNLLYMMEKTTAVHSERVVPEIEYKGSRERNKKRAEQKAHEDGKSLLPYTVLRLSPKVKSVRTEPSSKVTTRKLKFATWVNGHFHDYWVLSPGDEKVSETKEGVGGKLSRVTRYLTPYKMGERLPERPVKTVLVVP